MAFVALARRPDGSHETLGVARSVADPDNIEAEFAIIVRSDMKGRGLGHLLLDKLVRYQRAHGTERLVGEVLQENLPMRELARSLGFAADTRVAEGGALRHVLDLQGRGGVGATSAARFVD
jgi:acetyltransferase